MPSHTPDVIMTLVSYFWGLPGHARKARKHYQDTARVAYQSDNWPKQCDASLCCMPPGKKTKNTLACVFTVANVLGTWQRYHRPLLIYRYISCIIFI